MSSSDDDAPAGLGARGRKRSRKASDDAMLGVFGDSSEDEGGGGGGGRGGGRGGRERESKRPLAEKPVSFAKAAAPSAPPPPAPAPAAVAPADKAPPSRPSRGGLGSGGAKPLPAEKVDKEFGAFEAHSKGIGSRLLSKMGWKPGQGIGKAGGGVVNPLEQKLRPNSMGLGYGGFKETTSKAKAQQARILHGDGAADPPPSDAELDRANAAAAPRRDNWRRGERRELKVRSAQQLMAEWEGKARPQRGAPAEAGAAVVDMRGPQPRVHASLADADAAAAAGEEAAAAAGLLPELRHNMRMLVELSEVSGTPQTARTTPPTLDGREHTRYGSSACR